MGNKFSMKHTEHGNDCSPWYVDMDGANLSIGSTGTRLLMTVLGICFNDKLETVFIDEPEMGLSPKNQAIIVEYLYNTECRNKHFPHLKTLCVSTHSHVFLDRNDLRNNYHILLRRRKTKFQYIKWERSMNSINCNSPC